MRRSLRQRGIPALLLTAAFAAALFSLRATRPRALEGALHSDEPEWIAASALHWRQLVDGGPPAGAERTPTIESPWRAGFQSTTFGAVNPCLPKLVWGAALASTGRAEASPLVFQRFRGDPASERAALAALAPAEATARSVTLAAAALCGALLAGIATRLAGPVAGGVALALWLAAPLVQRWATYVRPDFLALAAALGTLAVALAARKPLGGARAAPRLLAAAAVGLAAGLAVSSKLNAAVAAAAVGAWVPALVALRRPGESAPLAARLARAGVAASTCAAAGALVVFALNPVLWSAPLAEGRAVLEFWGPHMEFQQDRAEAGGERATRTVAERFALAAERALVRDEPLRAATGIPLGALLAGAGAALLAARAARRAAAERSERAREARRDAALACLWLGVVLLGTTLWIPLDWDRYFLVYVAAAALLEGVAIAVLAGTLRRRGAELATSPTPRPTERELLEPAT